MKPCRTSLMLAVLNSIGADILTRYQPAANDDLDINAAAAISAVAYTLARPGAWRDLLAVHWTPEAGCLASWADNVDQAAATPGYWFHSWIQPLVDHAYDAGLIEVGT